MVIEELKYGLSDLKCVVSVKYTPDLKELLQKIMYTKNV